MSADQTTGFETKDSGERQQFASGMVRDTQTGKPRYDLAFDGPLAAAVFGSELIVAFDAWYREGGVSKAAEVVRVLAKLEGIDIYDLFQRYAFLMARGAVKYAERNWMKASGEEELSRFKASACRHLIQYVRGDRDEDHGAAIWFNMNGAEYVRQKLALKEEVPL
jgi:hypothetical protein